jgi:integrase
VRQSASFATKAEAVAWAAEVERGIVAGAGGAVARKSLADLLERYRDDVSARKRGERWERTRIDRMLRDDAALCALRLSDLSQSNFAAWRDRRLTEVSAATVRRDWTLLSHAFSVAINEWRWLTTHPLRGVRQPPEPAARDRLISDHEIELLLHALGYARDAAPLTITSRVGAALLFAIETAMRAGEIVGLQWPRVDLAGRVATLLMTKNGTARQVPLSREALRILDQLDPVTAPREDRRCFGIASTQSLDALFRKAKARAGVEGLTFHDSRHTAITRLARRLDVLALARMVGHRDIRMLQIYFNPSATDMARRLD